MYVCSLPSGAESPPQFSQGPFRSPSHVFDPTPDSFDGDVAPRVLSQSSICNATQLFSPTPDGFEESTLTQQFETSDMMGVSERTCPSPRIDVDPMLTSSPDELEQVAPGTPPGASTTQSATWSPHALFAPARAAAAATPKRQRRTRKSLKCSPQSEALVGKRRCSTANAEVLTPSKHVSEENRGARMVNSPAARLVKRRASVAGVKKRLEYKMLEDLRVRTALESFNTAAARALAAAPPTPEPTDESLSKRQWEDGVQDWVVSLKQWAAMHQANNEQIEQ